MSGDSRKGFIVATIGNFFTYSITDGAVSHIESSNELNNFLDDGNCSILAAHAELTQGVRLIQVYNVIEAENIADNWLVFLKLQPCVITPDNLHSNILISSLLESPIDTLYHTVQKIFSPVLLKDAKWSKSVDPKIQNLLTELEVGLGTVLRRHGKVGIASDKTSPDNELFAILTPSDEFQFWADVSVSGAKLAARERAQYFQELFEPIIKQFANLDALSFPDALELIEITQDTLDEVWKQTNHEPPYPEDRMKHLLEVLSGSFGRFVQRKLHELDVWNGQFSYVRNQIQDGLSITEKWSVCAEALTKQYWKQFASHPWKGNHFTSPTLLQLNERLEEVWCEWKRFYALNFIYPVHWTPSLLLPLLF